MQVAVLLARLEIGGGRGEEECHHKLGTFSTTGRRGHPPNRFFGGSRGNTKSTFFVTLSSGWVQLRGIGFECSWLGLWLAPCHLPGMVLDMGVNGLPFCLQAGDSFELFLMPSSERGLSFISFVCLFVVCIVRKVERRACTTF